MSDPKKDPDEQWLKTVRSRLDDGQSQLDDEVRRSLQQARREAVSVASQRRANHRVPSVRWLVPASGFALILLAAVLSFVIGIGPGHKPSPIDQASMASTDDLPLLTAPEGLELYEELDFYQWLEEEQAGVG
jgi:hypothetical protein